jgi:hypothetical protein
MKIHANIISKGLTKIDIIFRNRYVNLGKMLNSQILNIFKLQLQFAIVITKLEIYFNL